MQVNAPQFTSFGSENSITPKAEFIRLPKSGTRCPLTGLSRSSLNALILPTEENNFKPPVRSVSIRKRHAIRGTRLISVPSLLEFLQGLNTQTAGPRQEGGDAGR